MNLEVNFKLFYLLRHVGFVVDGTHRSEIVADGVMFPGGVCVLHWRGEHNSTAVYPNLESLIAVHGHGGATKIEQWANLTMKQVFGLTTNVMQDDIEGVANDFIGEGKPKNLEYVWKERNKFADLFRITPLNPTPQEKAPIGNQLIQMMRFAHSVNCVCEWCKLADLHFPEILKKMKG